MTPFTVAVDGPAASGKGTISRALAQEFGLAHLDTGLLYRAVALASLQGHDPVEAARTLSPDALADENALRTGDVAQQASRVAVLPEVRGALLDFQRAFARRAGGAVLDGRDIGTVICPQAEVKLFVTASAEIRAERRYLEMVSKGQNVTRAEVLEDVLARDARDMSRADAPLRAGPDAVTLDTTELEISVALAQAADLVRPAFEASRRTDHP